MGILLGTTLNSNNSTYVTLNSTKTSLPTVEHSYDPSLIYGKRCLAKYRNEKTYICYLNATDSNYYFDGTPALLDGTQGYFMVDLPEFWLEGTYDGVMFTTKIHREPVINSYCSRRVLLGAVEASVEDYYVASRILQINHNSAITIANYKLTSVAYAPANKPILNTANSNDLGTSTERLSIACTGYFSTVNFHKMANNIGIGWDIVDYESHIKVAWMYYCKYGKMDAQAAIGSGQSSYNRAIGTTSTIGNLDTIPSTATSLKNVNIFGLENWWGDKYEWMSGISNVKGTIYIQDGLALNSSNQLIVPSSSYRTVNVTNDLGITANTSGVITEMLLGEHCDLLPKATETWTNNYWYDYSSINVNQGNAATGAVASRSGDSASGGGGPAYLCLYDAPSGSGARCGSRLLYRGDIYIINNVQDFINL